MKTVAMRAKDQRINFPRVVMRQSAYANFKQLARAEGKTLAGFLDDVSQKLMSLGGGGLELIPKTPQQQVMEKLTTIDAKIDRLVAVKLADLTEARDPLFAVPAFPDREVPMIDGVMIRQALADNPDLKQVGWYSLGADGYWYFDQERFDTWDNEQRGVS